MTEPKLTARADLLLDTLCRVYRERLANGASDTQSRFFGSAEDIRRRCLFGDTRLLLFFQPCSRDLNQKSHKLFHLFTSLPFHSFFLKFALKFLTL